MNVQVMIRFHVLKVFGMLLVSDDGDTADAGAFDIKDEKNAVVSDNEDEEDAMVSDSVDEDTEDTVFSDNVLLKMRWYEMKIQRKV